jgi:putative oxidoreductase
MLTIGRSIHQTTRGYDLLIGSGSHLQSFVLLALRLTWGWQLLESGYGHLTHIEKTVEAFKSWGVPLPMLNVYISGTTELIGGALLVLGLATRLIALPLVFNFIVAFLTASRATLVQIVTGPQRGDGYDAFINDSAFPMLILALVMLAFGPGLFSVDRILKYKILPLLSNRALAGRQTEVSLPSNALRPTRTGIAMSPRSSLRIEA